MIFKKKSKEISNKTKNNSIENKQIVSFNTQYLTMSPYIESTVVKIPDNIMKGNLISKQQRLLSEQYLLNYKEDNNYIGYKVGISNFFKEDAAMTAVNLDLGEDLEGSISLPKPNKIKTALSTVITSRRSIRTYLKQPMSLQDFSNLFYYAQGVSDEVGAYNLQECNKNVKLRNAPSAGGLYPIELYAYVKNVKNIEDGIYRYYPYSHTINRKSLFSNDDVKKFAEFGYINVENANLIIFFVYNLPINSRKYGDAGLAYAFIEAGEIAQNIQLVATAMGYGACDIGGYEKRYIEDVLEIDGLLKHVIHTTIVGTPKED